MAVLLDYLFFRLPFCIVLLAILVGAVRSVFETSLFVSSILVAPVCLYPLFRSQFHLYSEKTSKIWLFALLAAAAAFFYYFWIMYSPPFDGLVSTSGGDAAEHLYRRYKFVHSNPEIYHGFVGFYVVTYWIEALFNVNSFAAFRAFFYLAGLLLFWLVFVAVFALAKNYSVKNSSKFLLLFAAVLVLGAVSVNKFLFPLLSYMQGDGFYPHLFGLIPIFAGMAGYTLISSRSVRLITLFVVVLLCRFSYGLNLADLLISFSLLLFFESKDEQSLHLSRILALASLLCFGIALYSYFLIFPLHTMEGGILHYNVSLAVTGNLLLALILLASPPILAHCGLDPSPEYRRLCRYTGAFAAISSAVAGSYLLLGLPENYYILKYTLHPAALVYCAGIVSAAYVGVAWLIHCLDNPRAVTVALLLCHLSVFAIGFWIQKDSYQIFRPHFEERRSKTINTEIIKPLADLKAWQIISQALVKNNARFGGFIATPDWALSGFMNAAFRYYHYREPRLHTSGKFRLNKGHCVFWNSQPSDYELIGELGSAPVARQLSVMEQSPDAVSQLYSVAWSSALKKITYICIH